jgi:hypothetical protein
MAASSFLSYSSVGAMGKVRKRSHAPNCHRSPACAAPTVFGVPQRSAHSPVPQLGCNFMPTWLQPCTYLSISSALYGPGGP